MIELKALNKKYDARGIAGITNLSLSLHPGEVLAVMGPNGSGKTTLINMILGHLSPDSGDIKVDGEAVAFNRDDSAEGNVQKYLIASNRLNIPEEKKLQLARDFADIFEFTFQLRQDLSQLSAGQRQKVALAAALVNRPSLFLMDEPFTHLDPHTRRDILKALFKYIKEQEISVLWVTHDLDEALNFSDRILLLNFGKIEQLGSPSELLEKPRSLFIAQFLGYENFLAVKNGQTPWGKIDTDFADSILVIPDWALHISSHGTKAISRSLNLRGQRKRLCIDFLDKDFVMALPRSAPVPAPGTSLFIQATLEECFLLPL